MSETLRLRPDALDWREVEGEIVALDVRASTYLAVNPTGASIWPALLEGATRDELVTKLHGSFDIDRPRAEADVDAFVRTLRERDLLEG
jgi:Coenzyme PQQ synthesis protein D (PqqD)